MYTAVSIFIIDSAEFIVTWLTSLFSTNMAISETKSRVESYQYPVQVSDILTSTLAAFLFSSHPKRERDREAHLNYYASADNRERQPSHHKTKLNNNNTNQHSSLTKNT